VARRRLFTRRRRDEPAADEPCADCAQEGVRPFGLLVPPEPVVAPDDVLARTPGRLDAVVDGQLLVFDPGRGSAHLLNPSAALVLTSVDGRSTVAEIADALSRETGVERDTIAHDVTDVLGTLVQGGLVTWFFHDPSEPVAAVVTETPTSVDRWRAVVEHRLDQIEWPYVAGPFHVGGAAVGVRTDDDDLAGRLTDAMRALPPAASGATIWLSVDRRDVAGTDRFRVHAGGERVGWVDDRDDAVGFALAGLNRLAADHTPGRLLLHAGVVEREGRVALLTGPSGRGKSTLTAASVVSGAAYLSDELAIVDPATRAVTPYAKALELDDDAVERLGLSDGSPVGTGHRREQHVAPGALGRVSAGGTVALLVLLEPPGAGEPAPTVLAPADAMLRLLPDVLPQTWTLPGALDALAELCERVPAIVLPRLELDEAVAVLAARLAAR
jgi:PqqD family protein of HPr-rel-A system